MKNYPTMTFMLSITKWYVRILKQVLESVVNPSFCLWAFNCSPIFPVSPFCCFLYVHHQTIINVFNCKCWLLCSTLSLSHSLSLTQTHIHIKRLSYLRPSVCVKEWEWEIKRERKKLCVCVCVFKRERVREREIECVCECVCVRYR